MTHSHPTREKSTPALLGGAFNVSNAFDNHANIACDIVLYLPQTVAFVERQFLPTYATPRSYKVSELYAPVTRLGFPGAAVHLLAS
jgi:hypothetical protein